MADRCTSRKSSTGRNKAFWHTAYEGTKVRGAGAARNANVPTPDMIAAVTDPTSKALLAQYQIPNSPSGTISTSAPNKTDAYQFSVRGDVNLGANDTLWGRYARSVSTNASSGLTFIATNLPNFGANSQNTPQQATLQEVHLFSPTVVNEFRFGFGRSTPAFPISTPYQLGPRVTFASAEVASFGVWEGLPQGDENQWRAARPASAGMSAGAAGGSACATRHGRVHQEEGGIARHRYEYWRRGWAGVPSPAGTSAGGRQRAFGFHPLLCAVGGAWLLLSGLGAGVHAGPRYFSLVPTLVLRSRIRRRQTRLLPFSFGLFGAGTARHLCVPGNLSGKGAKIPGTGRHECFVEPPAHPTG